MATIITAHGLIDKKLPTMKKGELFIDQTNPALKKLLVCTESAANGNNAEYTKLGSEQLLVFRGQRASVPTTSDVEKFDVYQITSKIDETENHPKLLKGDFILCVSKDINGVLSWLKLSGAGGEAVDLTFVGANTRLNHLETVQDALISLSRNPLDITHFTGDLDAYTALEISVEVLDGMPAGLVTLDKDLTIDGVSYLKNSIIYFSSTSVDVTGKPIDVTAQLIYEPSANKTRANLSDVWQRADANATTYYAAEDANLKYVSDYLASLASTKADTINGKILLSQLPETVLGGMQFNGTLNIDASLVTPTTKLLDYIPATNKEGVEPIDGDYWLLNIKTDEVLNEDVSTNKKIAAVIEGKTLHSGDYYVLQSLDGNISVDIIDNSDSFRALTDVDGNTVDGKVRMVATNPKLSASIDTTTNQVNFDIDNTILTTSFQEHFLPLFSYDENTNEKLVASTIKQLSPQSLNIGTAEIAFGENTKVSFPTSDAEEVIAYQSWVEDSVKEFVTNGLTNEMIPVYNETLKKFENSLLRSLNVPNAQFKVVEMLDNTLLASSKAKLTPKDLSGQSPEEIAQLGVNDLFSGTATFLEMRTKTNQLRTFVLDGSEISSEKQEVKIYHEDSVIDCGQWM